LAQVRFLRRLVRGPESAEQQVQVDRIRLPIAVDITNTIAVSSQTTKVAQQDIEVATIDRPIAIQVRSARSGKRHGWHGQHHQHER
jgi:hypothetical protein